MINFPLPVRNIQLEPHCVSSALGPLPTGRAPLLGTHIGSAPSCWCRTICFPQGLMFYRGFLLFFHLFFCSAVSCKALTGSPCRALTGSPCKAWLGGAALTYCHPHESPVNLGIIAFGLKDGQSPWRSWMGANCIFQWKNRSPEEDRLKRERCV